MRSGTALPPPHLHQLHSLLPGASLPSLSSSLPPWWCSSSGGGACTGGARPWRACVSMTSTRAGGSASVAGSSLDGGPRDGNAAEQHEPAMAGGCRWRAWHQAEVRWGRHGASRTACSPLDLTFTRAGAILAVAIACPAADVFSPKGYCSTGLGSPHSSLSKFTLQKKFPT